MKYVIMRLEAYRSISIKSEWEIPVEELFIVCITLAHQNTINKAVGGFDNDNGQKTIYSLYNFHNYSPVMYIPQ